MQKPRKGSSFFRNGKPVQRRAHLWTPPTADPERAHPSGQTAAALGAMAATEEELPPLHRVHHRFDLGVPVEDKADRLDTEIGVVEFTEDLIVGFDAAPSPVTEAESWDMVVEAADRYARLSAFIAAEQGLTCEELCGRPERFKAQDTSDIPPRRVRDAVKRRRGERVHSDDELVDRIVATLEGSVDEDPAVLLKAANCFRSYLLQNKAALYLDSTLDAEINLTSALQSTDLRGPLARLQLGDNRTLDDNGSAISTSYTFDAAAHAADPLLSGVDAAAMVKLERDFTRSPSTPFIERFSAGVRVNLTDEWSVEVENLRPNPQIRRVYNDGTGKRVLEVRTWSSLWRSTSSTDVLVLAADFRRPFYTRHAADNVVGFSRRNDKRAEQGR